MFCSRCRAALKAGAKFCARCGYPVQQNRIEEESMTKPVQPPEAPPKGRQPELPRAELKGSAERIHYTGQPMQEAKSGKTGGILRQVLTISLLVLLLAGSAGGGYLLYHFFVEERFTEAPVLKEDRGQKGENRKKDGEEETEKDTEEEEESEPETRGSESAAVTTAAVQASESIAAEEAFSAPEFWVTRKADADLSGYTLLHPTNVTESSYLVQKDPPHYINYGGNAFDGDRSSSWQDGVDTNGVGEWVQAYFAGMQRIQAIVLVPGNHRTEELYKKNNRPSRMGIYLGELYYSVPIPDEYQEFAVSFSFPIEADAIKLVIEDFYSGSQYNDMAVAEIEVYGN